MTRAAALVTGAGGFLGGFVCRRLRERGVAVRGMVLSAQQSAEWRTPGVDPVIANLLDVDSLRAAVQGVSIVYHCAAKIPGQGTAAEIWRANVDGTGNLLDACVGLGVERFVFVSSDSIYGDGHLPAADELTPPHPFYFSEGIYPRSKLEGERLVLERHQAGRLSAAIIRPCLMYGPGASVGTEFLRRLAARRVHRFIDGGRARLSLGYVEDVAEGVVLAGTTPAAAGQAYNVCDGQPRSMRAIVATLAAVANRPLRGFSYPTGPFWAACRLMHPIARRVSRGWGERIDPDLVGFLSRDHVMQIAKARAQLGYHPTVMLAEGCRRMFEWLERPTPIL